MALLFVAVLAASTIQHADAFYRTGAKPNSFRDGDAIHLKKNKLTSSKTLFPIAPYSLPFCQPPGGPKQDNENLGELLSGDRIESSPYVLHMRKDVYCGQICYTDIGPEEKEGLEPNKFVNAIKKEYHNNWILDGLTAASKIEDENMIVTHFWQDFPIGFVLSDDNKNFLSSVPSAGFVKAGNHQNLNGTFIYNHVNIEVEYHPVDNETYNVVRFIVQPFSIKHDFIPSDGERTGQYEMPKIATINNPIESCAPGIKYHTNYDMIAESTNPQPAHGNVLFTYDVIWRKNLFTPWASRWDIYLTMDNAIPKQVHQFRLIPMLVSTVIIAALIAVVLVKNLREDLDRYNHQLPTDEASTNKLSEGWRAIHGDIFRAPPYPAVLSVFCGTGMQILFAVLLTTSVALAGYINSARPGSIITVSIVIFASMGSVSGFVSARLFKTFTGETSRLVTAATATFFPGLAMSTFAFANVLAARQESTMAVPATVFGVLVVLWIGLSVPLAVMGACLGYKMGGIELPVEVSANDPRPILRSAWCPCFLFGLLSVILSYFVFYVEYYFIMATVWMGYFYHEFGFLLMSVIVLAALLAELSAISNYFFIRREDYRWGWRSWFISSSVAVLVFLDSCVFYVHQFQGLDSLASYALYFGYMSLISCGLALMAGSIGFIGSLWFNIIIYGALKSDQALA